MPRKTRQNLTDGDIIRALIGTRTHADAARRLGCHERTISRRLEDASFRAAVDAARAKMTDDVLQELRAAGLQAVRTLRRLLKADSDMIRVQAARSILDGVLKSRESELEKRLQAIEAKLEATP